MKLNKMGRAGLASVLSLAMIGVTACSRDYVLAYLYVTTAKPLASGSNNGGVSAFAIDYQAGTLTPPAAMMARSAIAIGSPPALTVGVAWLIENVALAVPLV